MFNRSIDLTAIIFTGYELVEVLAGRHGVNQLLMVCIASVGLIIISRTLSKANGTSKEKTPE